MDFSSEGLGRGDEMPPALPVPGALDPLRSLLHSISSRLSDVELSGMTFLCQDKIGKRKLAAVQSGQEFFNILLEQQEITKNNLELLKKLLQHIKRKDLLSEVVQFEEGQLHQFEEGQLYAPDDQPDEHEKRLLNAAVAVISDYVGKEWKRLMRELGMPEVKLERIEARYPRQLYEQLVQALREWEKGKGKDAKVADLTQALQRCNLNLVVDKVNDKISQLNTGTR